MSEQVQVQTEPFSFGCPSNEFRRVIQALEPVNDPLAVHILATGMRLGALNPSHVSMAIADLEPNFFHDWDSTSKMNVSLPIASLLKLWPEDVHVSPIKFKISPEKTIVTLESASVFRTFELPTRPPGDDATPWVDVDEKKYVPTTEIGVGTNAWRDAVTTISKMSRGVRLEAKSTGVVLKAFEPDVVLAGSCALSSWHGEIQDESVAHYSVDFIVPFLEPLTKLADHVLVAFGSDMPLRITAKFHHGICRFWFSPRIYEGDST